MTDTRRAKQIEEAAHKLCQNNNVLGFMMGSEWADQNPSCGLHVKCDQLEQEITRLQAQLGVAKECLDWQEIATSLAEAVKTMFNNGAKASDERWLILREALEAFEKARGENK